METYENECSGVCLYTATPCHSHLTSSPHWASSEQSPQSHTKLHTASMGLLQWLGTQDLPRDCAAGRVRAM